MDYDSGGYPYETTELSQSKVFRTIELARRYQKTMSAGGASGGGASDWTLYEIGLIKKISS